MTEEEDKEIVDVIIVGAGISGLYAAYRLKQKSPELKILVFEAKGKKKSNELISFFFFYFNKRSSWWSNINS